MNALRNIHAVLAAGGVVVDTQPVSPTPRVLAGGEDLGSLDMRAWAGTIQAVDERTKTVVSEGRFELEHEERFVVVDSFDGGRACLDTAGTWRDTSVPRALAWRLEQTSGLVTVEQEVRLRLLRRTG